MSAPFARVTDPVRLAVGTLTVLPTPPPSTVDRRVAGRAMALAPLVGLLLGLAGGLLLWLLGWGGHGASRVLDVLPGGVQALLAGDGWFSWGVGPTLAAALTVGLLALLTRAMHLDGLADTADGLGSGRPAREALEVMRRGDVGPFGVVTLVLMLLVQVLALGQLVERGLGPSALLLALLVSRLVLPLLCLRGVPSAREDGLGAVVVGSVAPGQLAVSVVVAAAALLVSAAATTGPSVVEASVVARAAVAGLLGLGAAVLLAVRAVRRLGGLTGDVLGAGVETAFTVTLVVLTFLA